MVSEASTSVFISGAEGMRDAKRGEGVQEPDMRVRVRFWSRRVLRKADIRAGVISRSPVGDVARGLGDKRENAGEVSGTVEAHVSRRLGRVTRRRTEALKSVRVK